MVQGITNSRPADVQFSTAPAAAMFHGEGTKPTGDKISSAKENNSESWGQMFYRFACMPFNAIAWVAKKLVCCLTLGYCCNDAKAAPEAILKDVKAAIEKQTDDKAKSADKKSAFEGVFAAHSHLKADTKAFCVQVALEDKFGEDLNDKKPEAQKPVIEAAEKKFEELYKKQDAQVLEIAQAMLDKEIADAKAEAEKAKK